MSTSASAPSAFFGEPWMLVRGDRPAIIGQVANGSGATREIVPLSAFLVDEEGVQADPAEVAGLCERVVEAVNACAGVVDPQGFRAQADTSLANGRAAAAVGKHGAVGLSLVAAARDRLVAGGLSVGAIDNLPEYTIGFCARLLQERLDFNVSNPGEAKVDVHPSWPIGDKFWPKNADPMELATAAAAFMVLEVDRRIRADMRGAGEEGGADDGSK